MIIRCWISGKVKESTRNGSWGNGSWRTNSWRVVETLTNEKTVVKGLVAGNAIKKKKEVDSLVKLLGVEDLH